MQKINPFLWFDEQAEEAVHFYTSVFQNGSIGDISRYGDDVPGPKGKVMVANFQIAGLEMGALNGGPMFSFTPANSFFVTCQTEAEINDLWARLGEGGKVLMDLDRYPFSEKFGWLSDRYGLSWQLSLAGLPQKVTPFLMFVGAQNGRAEEAMRFYTGLFKNASITSIDRYGPGMGETEGNVMHARFILDGQEFMASENGAAHAFNFTPAVSYLVNCEDQEEVDHFWYQLSAGGEESQCGWLVDKFGVSWQIVPTILGRLMSDPDEEKASRVTQAMLKMSKIDIGQLQRAYDLA